MHIPQRHGCLTAWLYLIIVGSTFGLLGLLFLSQATPPRPGYHPPSALTLELTAVCMVTSLVCAGGLFFLKRWAFYGYIVANLALIGVNVQAKLPLGGVVAPLIWSACLIGVMQIGGRYKGWGRLR